MGYLQNYSYLVQQSNDHPLGAVDDPMNCCNSSSGHPQHLGGDSFDCCTEKYEIVVYCVLKNQHLVLIIMSPPCKSEDILLYPLHLSVGLSVCGSVCPSQNRVCSIN